MPRVVRLRNTATPPLARVAPGQLGTAVWLGLLAGLLELAVLGWRKFVNHAFLGLGLDTVWLTPLAYVVLALGGVALAWMAGRLSPRFRLEVVRLGIVLTLITGSLLSLAGGLAKWSVLLLATGIGVQAARLLIRSKQFERLVRATLGLLVALVVALGVGVAGRRQFARYTAIAALPAAPPGAPNVLVISWDVVRGASVSAMGYARRTTPNLEQWAGRGVRFTSAQAPSSWTLPSHASMFTGRGAFELSSDWNQPLDDAFPTLAEQFARQGYLTGGFVGNTFRCGYETGLQRGFQTYEDYRVSVAELTRGLALARSVLHSERFRQLTGLWDEPGRRSAAQVNARLLRWLDQRGTRPFFAFLNYFDAHDPYLPRAPFDTMFGPVLPRLDPGVRSSTNWTATGIRAERDSYERAIAGLDADFGLLMDQLDARGLLRNTLVIVVGDHGEEFGEHGQMSHGHTLYLPSVQVPLVLGFPERIPAGRVVTSAVSLQNLAATIQSVAGLPGPRLPGRSLESAWTAGADTVHEQGKVVAWVGRSGFNTDWPSSRSDVWSVTWNGWRYLRYGEHEELYHLPADSGETTDLTRRPPLPEVLPVLRAAIDSVQLIRESRGVANRNTIQPH